MSNEDYVKQGRSDKLLGREGYKVGYKKRGRGRKPDRRRSGNLFSGSTITGVMLALADGCTPSRLSLREVASGLRGECEGKTRGEVLRCP